MKLLGRILFIILSLFWAVSASGQQIRTTQIDPSTDMRESNRFPLEQINDGITSDVEPYNGFETNNQSGTISFALDKDYDVSAFILWNDINVRLEGVKTFDLAFFDANNQLISRVEKQKTGTTKDAVGRDLGLVDAQRFEFPTVKNVKRVDLIVTSVFTTYHRNPIKRIEIREIEFEGTASQVDQPCKRTRRLNDYLTRVERVSTDLQSDFTKLESLMQNLPSEDLLGQRLPDSSNCSSDIWSRVRSLRKRMSQLSSTQGDLGSVSSIQSAMTKLTNDHIAFQDAVRNAQQNMAACVPPSEYRDWDNLIGGAMEGIGSLETQIKDLRRAMELNETDNFQSTDYQKLVRDIDDLRKDILTCGEDVIPNEDNLPPVTKDNVYRLFEDRTLTVDPLSDDRDPEEVPLIMSAIGTPPAGITVRPNGKLLDITGVKPGQYEFSISVSDTKKVTSSKITVEVLSMDPPTPWWVWPLGVAGLLGALLFGFKVFRSKASVSAEPATGTAKPASQGVRRLLRSHLRQRKDDGVPFAKSPLIASVTEPGPPPKEPIGHNIPLGLATISGPYGVLMEAYRATGRIGFAQEGVPTNDDVSLGTGFLIGRNLVMTNQHVYQAYKHYLEGDECGGIEFIAERDRDASDYYAFDGNPPIVLPELDIAIFRTAEKVENRHPIKRVHIPTDDLAEREVIVVGYPCPFEVDDYILSLVEPDPIFAVKRVTQGQVFRHSTDKDAPFGILYKVDQMINPREELTAVCHNATTLPGNSGSPVLCAKTGKLVGVHFAGSRSLFGEEAANLAMAIEKILEKEEGEEF